MLTMFSAMLSCGIHLQRLIQEKVRVQINISLAWNFMKGKVRVDTASGFGFSKYMSVLHACLNSGK